MTFRTSLARSLTFVAAAFSLTAAAQTKDETLTLKNPGFEAAELKRSGWNLRQHAGDPAYDFDLDKTVAFEGKQSLRITRTKEQVYGAAYQLVSDLPRGKYRLSAMMRCKDTERRGWRLLAIATPPSGFTEVYEAPRCVGTKDWHPVSVEFSSDAEPFRVVIDIALSSAGIGWADRVELVRVQP
jgi:hypothetical protein